MPVRYLALALLVAGASWACSGSPTAPSAFSPSAGGNIARGFDEHEPPPPGAPVTTLVISIISSFGPGAYLPNPLWDAVVGTMLVWNNEDTRPHHIVLEDGTDLGMVMPGQMTAAVPLTTASTSYTCLIHPSMAGTINRMLPPGEDPYPEYGSRRRPQR